MLRGKAHGDARIRAKSDLRCVLGLRFRYRNADGMSGTLINWRSVPLHGEVLRLVLPNASPRTLSEP